LIYRHLFKIFKSWNALFACNLKGRILWHRVFFGLSCVRHFFFDFEFFPRFDKFLSSLLEPLIFLFLLLLFCFDDAIFALDLASHLCKLESLPGCFKVELGWPHVGKKHRERVAAK